MAFTTTTGEVIKKTHIGGVACGEPCSNYTQNKTLTIIKLLIEEEIIRKGGISIIRLSSSERYENVKISMPFNLRTVFDCVRRDVCEESKIESQEGLESSGLN